MDEFRPNSHKSKEEKKKIEKVANGTVKKKNEIRKFADVFISEDINNVGTYIFQDILVPSIKKAISDIIVNGIDMILYGESGKTKRKSSSNNESYRNYYDRNRERDRPQSRNKSAYSYDDIILDSRGEAEDVLSKLDELIDIYGMASVADFYELVGVSGSYTDNKYGWTDIRTANVVRSRDGYIVKLPRALPL